MNTCESFSESFSDYVENSAHPEQRQSLDAHLAQCPSCHAAVTRLQNLRTHMRSLPRVKASPDFETLLRARIMLERRKARVFPHVTDFGRMPRVALYAFTGVVILLATSVFWREWQNASADTKRVANDEIITSSFYEPSDNASLQATKVFYPLDKIPLRYQRPQKLSHLWHEPVTRADSLADRHAIPSGQQLKTASF